MNAPEAESTFELLIDTGCVLSLIKPSVLQDDVQCTALKKPVILEGIGEGVQTATHFVELKLNNKLRHTFFIVSDNFSIDQDGILGDDFFSSNKAVIDYRNNKLKCKNFNFPLLRRSKLNVSIRTVTRSNPHERYQNDDSTELSSVSDESEMSEDSSRGSESCEEFDNHEDNHSISDDENNEISTEINVYNDLSEASSQSLSEEDFSDSNSESGLGDDVAHSSNTDSEFSSDSESDSCDDAGESPASTFDSSKAVMIKIPKQSGVYATIKLTTPGTGTVPEIHFSDEVFSISSLVETSSKFAKVPFLNTSDEDVVVEVPPMELKYWNPSWDKDEAPNQNIASVMKVQHSDRLQKLLEKFNFSHLNDEEHKAITDLISRYSDVFYVDGDKVSENTDFDHEINLKDPDVKPIKLKQFRIPYALTDVLAGKIDEMVENDLIEESNSPWNLPTFLVPKKPGKDGKRKYRLVTDMRKLNDLIVQDAFPLPVIDEVLGRLGNATYFSVLDLWNGFYQLGLAPESRKYTSFSACGKKYHYKKLPMGLMNAPAWFSRMITKVLGDYVPNSCLVYLDDIISFSHDLKMSIKNLEKVFHKLREARLKLQPEKCDFLQKECQYLGHRIAQDGIFPDESKFSAVKNFTRPKDKKGVRSFLGLTGFYRKFIKDYGKIAQPLNALTSPNADFHWTEKHENAFSILKQKLLESPVLAHPDFSKEFILTTDASGVGIAGVLSQIQDGKERPIGYCSRSLKPREAIFAKDNATENELLAISWAAKYFRPYLYGKHFTVYCDNKALVHLSKINNENPRIMKYKLELEEYQFTIKHKAGSSNGNADALSRMFVLKVLSDELDQETIMNESHSSKLAGHKGVDATIAKIKDAGFTWPSIAKDVKNFVRKCKSCQTNKCYSKTKLPMKVTDTPSRPMEKIAIDLVEELPMSPEGYKHILTIQDNFSKHLWGIPLKTKNAEEIAEKFAQEFILKFGIPDRILSDQGASFDSKLFKNLCKIFNIQKIRTSSHHPQSNGSLERCHRSMKEYFRHFINANQTNWAELIQLSCFAHNTTRHSVTGFTPYEILHGFKITVPSSFDKPNKGPLYTVDEYVSRLRFNLKATYQIVREKLIKNKQKNKKIYDRSTKPVLFKVGEQVQLLNENTRQGRSKKLEQQWLGPYTVMRKIDDLNYEIKMGRKTHIVHGNRLKTYYD